MKQIRCIVVDDEPLARELIRDYIGKLPELELVASCSGALEAFRKINETEIDLMFLDIQMPELTGIDFLKNVSNLPPVIITTAHREFALEGFDLNVIDYLLKPIRFERFLKAIDKVKHLMNRMSDQQPEDKSDFIHVKADRKIHQLRLSEILYLESEGDYVKVTTYSKVILTKQTLANMEKQLPSDKFLRIHRSVIIAKDKVESFDSTMVEIGKRQFPIGKNFRETVARDLI